MSFFATGDNKYINIDKVAAVKLHNTYAETSASARLPGAMRYELRFYALDGDGLLCSYPMATSGFDAEDEALADLDSFVGLAS